MFIFIVNFLGDSKWKCEKFKIVFNLIYDFKLWIGLWGYRNCSWNLHWTFCIWIKMFTFVLNLIQNENKCWQIKNTKVQIKLKWQWWLFECECEWRSWWKLLYFVTLFIIICCMPFDRQCSRIVFITLICSFFVFHFWRGSCSIMCSSIQHCGSTHQLMFKLASIPI